MKSVALECRYSANMSIWHQTMLVVTAPCIPSLRRLLHSTNFPIFGSFPDFPSVSVLNSSTEFRTAVHACLPGRNLGANSFLVGYLHVKCQPTAVMLNLRLSCHAPAVCDAR